MSSKIKNAEKIKSKNDALKKAMQSDDLDEVLKNIEKIDNTCCFVKCKTKTSDFAIECKYCGNRFCTSHGLPEIHGCGEAVRKDERQQFLHENPKLSVEKHEKASTKLSMKLKQMQLERKSKQGYKSNEKKK